MFVSRRTGERTPQFIPETCPSVEILKRKEVQPLCFMAFMKSLNHHLVGGENDPVLVDPESVMFVPDSSGIFDSKYPGYVRDITGVNSWGNVNPENLHRIMSMLYWYRKHGSRFKIPSLIKDGIDILGFNKMKMWIKQTIHEINGMVIKQFYALGPQIQNYAKLNEHIAQLFKHILAEYIGPDIMDIYKTTPVFQELKSFYKQVKEYSKFKHFEYSFPCL
jgi:hypothetical protein